MSKQNQLCSELIQESNCTHVTLRCNKGSNNAKKTAETKSLVSSHKTYTACSQQYAYHCCIYTSTVCLGPPMAGDYVFHHRTVGSWYVCTGRWRTQSVYQALSISEIESPCPYVCLKTSTYYVYAKQHAFCNRHRKHTNASSMTGNNDQVQQFVSPSLISVICFVKFLVLHSTGD